VGRGEGQASPYADQTNLFHGSVYFSMYPVNENTLDWFFVFANVRWLCLFVEFVLYGAADQLESSK
jgi:hypothetical protein